jgi:hypothetical protein
MTLSLLLFFKKEKNWEPKHLIINVFEAKGNIGVGQVLTNCRF